jgi:DNA-binding CsgD family transcriptional regulator
MLTARRGTHGLARLTPRDSEVLTLMAHGLSNTAIAAALVVTPGAVEKFISSTFTKLDLPPSDGNNRRVMAVLCYLQSTYRRPPSSRPRARAPRGTTRQWNALIWRHFRDACRAERQSPAVTVDASQGAHGWRQMCALAYRVLAALSERPIRAPRAPHRAARRACTVPLWRSNAFSRRRSRPS